MRPSLRPSSSSLRIAPLAGRFRSLGLAAFVVTSIACSQASSEGDDGAEPETAEGELRNVAKWIGPPPGTKNNAVDKDLVLNAWKKVKHDFYDTTDGYQVGWTGDAGAPVQVPAAPPSNAEPGQCLSACPTWWSDLVCHFYCWHPSYQPVHPNVRACFSTASRGLTRTDPVTNQPRQLYYPEVYDHCVFQNSDYVMSRTVPYDQAAIDANKQLLASSRSKAKKRSAMPGALWWVQENEADAFRYVMYTWYDPDTFDYKDQQKVIDDFYASQGLTRPPRPTDSAATATANPVLTPHAEATRMIDWMKKYSEANAR